MLPERADLPQYGHLLPLRGRNARHFGQIFWRSAEDITSPHHTTVEVLSKEVCATSGDLNTPTAYLLTPDSGATIRRCCIENDWICGSTFQTHAVKLVNVDPQKPKPEVTPDIQEILRNRREMLNRVKADLERVGKLQQDFWGAEAKSKGQAEESGK